MLTITIAIAFLWLFLTSVSQAIIDLAWYTIRLRELLGKRELVSGIERIVTTKSMDASTVFEQFKCFTFSFVG